MEHEQNEQFDEYEDWSDTYEFTCLDCDVPVGKFQNLCKRCENTNRCHCGARTESLKTFLCIECDKEQSEWERRQLIMLVDVHLFRKFWWRHCWDIINYYFLSGVRLRIVLLRKKYF